MLRYTIRRLLQGIITVWFIATATFVAMHSVPGDPLIQNKAVTAQIRKNLEIKYGLDKPITQQYLIYMGNMLKGDFGISFTQQNRSVNDIIVKHFPGVRDARHPRDRLRGDRRHLVGRAHGALPQSLAGRRDHVSRDPRHLGAELRLRGAGATRHWCI